MAPSSIPDSPLSNDFICPTIKDVQAKLRSDGDSKITYLCGNSLGLPSKRSTTLVQEELNVWGTHAVVGHFSHPHGRPWTKYTDKLNPLMAELVGAKEKEVACMGTLTNNLHLMMDSFYKPTADRYKILCEAKAFPSDQYAFASQVKAHGLDLETAIREVSPRAGEYTLREDDILEIIENEGSSIALVLFSGVQYYTGQWFPMESITRKAKEQGCICGWDLAHAVGNVPLSLHDWGVDFAVWCTYKYLNSSPGGIAGLYMHEKWNATQRPKFAGWWGHELATRFAMPPKFSPIAGAQGFQQSNPCILALASLLGSLQTFKEAGMMGPVRERSLLLTGTLEELLLKSKYFVPVSELRQLYPQPGSGKPGFTIITPSDASQRGAQLSLLFLPTGSGVMQKIFAALSDYGVIGDEREPDVIRLAPAALYNSIDDCEQAVRYLEKAFDSLE
ncbi:putative catalyzes the cleavage of L-kynurenine (L-Kyn) and L-3- hydroxykynurenine (L-3OHKyn) into anthranilic acid (AA) and 3- hydroxyanthranilic acid (3-OHAA), respectively [Lyophyllum shimeji]|uniref:Kynureninase n=1 Tax=Lyophyllum shimeji TaxID=47721 RepID=A0A9P3PGJ1_LYOSH|nr:putative catalyzes the cleavage of L-kynurenine (L-Kyn) and L-3- hydroxykynurenine (L-3OHKyn) into anthranilic acid (AA) and 3- hydroxyanthranilic acid (3-OHAA), respectively [Lyophyllum shimeji]